MLFEDIEEGALYTLKRLVLSDLEAKTFISATYVKIDDGRWMVVAWLKPGIILSPEFVAKTHYVGSADGQYYTSERHFTGFFDILNPGILDPLHRNRKALRMSGESQYEVFWYLLEKIEPNKKANRD